MKRSDRLASKALVRPGQKIRLEKLDRQATDLDLSGSVGEGYPRPNFAQRVANRAIQFEGRIYTSPAVQDFSASIARPTLVEIEINPHDLTSIRAKLNGKWHRVPSITEYAQLRTRHVHPSQYRLDRLSAPADAKL